MRGLGGFEIIAVLIVVIGAAVLYRRLSKGRRIFRSGFAGSMRLAYSRRAIIGCFSFLVILGLGLIAAIPRESQDKTASAEDNKLTVTASDVELKVKPTKDGAFAYAASEVTVTVDASLYGGYDLAVYTENKGLVNSKDSEAVIGRVDKSSVLDNTWGVATTKPNDASHAIWLPVAEQSEGSYERGIYF